MRVYVKPKPSRNINGDVEWQCLRAPELNARGRHKLANLSGRSHGAGRSKAYRFLARLPLEAAKGESSMNFRILVAAGAAVLISAGVALAQGATTTTPSSTPSVTHAAAAPTSTSHSASTHTESTHASATGVSSASSSGEAISCRTSHDVGGPCACRKAPTRHGTVEAGANGGHNMCAVPASHHA